MGKSKKTEKHKRKTGKFLSVQLSAPSPTQLSKTEKPFKGDECRKSFSHIINTKKHKKSQTRNVIKYLGSKTAPADLQTEREGPLKSEQCSNLFGCISKLKKHKKNHAPTAWKGSEEPDAPQYFGPKTSTPKFVVKIK